MHAEYGGLQSPASPAKLSRSLTSPTKGSRNPSTKSASSTVRLVPQDSDQEGSRAQSTEAARKRAKLVLKRRLIADVALSQAFFGVALVILNTELILAGYYDVTQMPSVLIKLVVSMTTGLLLIFILWYHILDARVEQCDDSRIDHWTLSLTCRRLLTIILEIFICSIHPLPLALHTEPPSQSYPSSLPPSDIFLTVPMFLRFYLVCRSFVLHNKLCTSSSLQTLGALNRTKFTFGFILRSMMLSKPCLLLVVFMTTMLAFLSWLLHIVDHTTVPHIADATWVVVITFLTVGYGDIYPKSQLGRLVAVATGLFGIGCMALVVAVLTQKLELSRSERYVHDFILKFRLHNEFKVAASNVIKAAWNMSRYRRAGNRRLARSYQRHLANCQQVMRQKKMERLEMEEANLSVVEVYNLQTVTHNMLMNTQNSHQELVGRLNSRLELLEKQTTDVRDVLRRIEGKITLPERPL